MSEPEGHGGAVVIELARRFQAGDAEGAFGLFHPDIRIEQPASLPHGGWHSGRDGVAAMGAIFSSLWERTIGQPRYSAATRPWCR